MELRQWFNTDYDWSSRTITYLEENEGNPIEKSEEDQARYSNMTDEERFEKYAEWINELTPYVPPKERRKAEEVIRKTREYYEKRKDQ